MRFGSRQMVLGWVALVAVVVVTFFWARPGPTEAAGGQAVFAGSAHTCAATTGGGVKCWGNNPSGQLGDGTATDRTTPVEVVGLTSGVAAIAAGTSHTCALTTGGGVKCWGDNSIGQLGDGSFLASPTPVQVLGLGSGVVAIAAGGSHTCALTTTSSLRCWGRNTLGELGDGTSGNIRTIPVDVVGIDADVDAITAGGQHTCALTTTGRVKCWGSNYFGQLGDGTNTQQPPWGNPAPRDVLGLSGGVASVVAGGAHTCAITTGGGLKCWGRNNEDQLGAPSTERCQEGTPGSTPCSTVPLDVTSLGSGVAMVAPGSMHTCAAVGLEGVKCWGHNADGQLGDGTTENRVAPVQVQGIKGGDILVLVAGGSFNCVVTTTGSVECWGRNGRGQLGDGSTVDRSTAVKVVGLELDDFDEDGCTNTRELGDDALLGGQRNTKNFWDFFDTPNASNARDQVIDIGDIFRVVDRFGTFGDGSIDPLSAPPASGYHTAFDRSPPQPAAGPWDLGPPDGTVGASDILLSVAQFGHSCS